MTEGEAQGLEARVSALLEGADLSDVSTAHAVSLRLDARGPDGLIGGRQWLLRPAEPNEVRAPATRESAQADMLRSSAEVLRANGESGAHLVNAAGGALGSMAGALASLQTENESLRDELRQTRRELADAKAAEARALAGQTPWEIELIRVLGPIAPALLASLRGRMGGPAKAPPKAAPPKEAPKEAPKQITVSEAEEVLSKVWDSLSEEDRAAVQGRLLAKAMGGA